MKTRLKGLLPIIDRATRVLILGSFPSELSLEKRKYYANPRNCFWKFISEVLNEPAPSDYRLKKVWLKKHKIGLWDVIAACCRESALDRRIRIPIPNDFKKILKKYPNIEAIFLVGRKAEKIFNKVYSNLKVPCRYLPSTSSANTRQSLRLKISQWKKIRNYL